LIHGAGHPKRSTDEAVLQDNATIVLRFITGREKSARFLAGNYDSAELRSSPCSHTRA
jgi:hypothetical protein